MKPVKKPEKSVSLDKKPARKPSQDYSQTTAASPFSKSEHLLPNGENLILVGHIVGCVGLKGIVKVRTCDTDPNWLESTQSLWLYLPSTEKKEAQKAILKEYPLKGLEWQQGRMVYAQFSAFPDRTAVEPYVGAEVYLPESALPACDANEYRVNQLVGLSVLKLSTGETIGTVVDVLSSGSDGAHEFLEIEVHPTKETLLVPFVEAFCSSVDLEQKHLTLTGIDELIEEAQQTKPAKPGLNLETENT
jgi:16S rRNA processing protein RimM